MSLRPSSTFSDGMIAGVADIRMPYRLRYASCQGQETYTQGMHSVARSESMPVGASSYNDNGDRGCSFSHYRSMLPNLISTHVTKPILINLRQASSSSSSIINRERLFDMLDQLFPSPQSADQRPYSESIAEDTFLLPWWRAPPTASDSTFERLSRLAYQICFACLQPDIWPPILSTHWITF